MPEQPKVIRKRIKSVTSTKKITRTMEMVATAKLKSAQQRVASSGPYLENLAELIGFAQESERRVLGIEQIRHARGQRHIACESVVSAQVDDSETVERGKQVRFIPAQVLA